MSEKNDNLIPAEGGVFSALTTRFKLVFRLMMDPRVNVVLKLLPIGSLVYLISPIDLMPAFPLDDAAIIWLASIAFVELCPPDIVEEHMAAITGLIQGTGQDPLEEDSEVIDAEFHEEK
jgi:uncharacterized membrane protein YkvA (DUF1232 family)